MPVVLPAPKMGFSFTPNNAHLSECLKSLHLAERNSCRHCADCVLVTPCSHVAPCWKKEPCVSTLENVLISIPWHPVLWLIAVKLVHFWKCFKTVVLIVQSFTGSSCLAHYHRQVAHGCSACYQRRLWVGLEGCPGNCTVRHRGPQGWLSGRGQAFSPGCGIFAPLKWKHLQVARRSEQARRSFSTPSFQEQQRVWVFLVHVHVFLFLSRPPSGAVPRTARKHSS